MRLMLNSRRLPVMRVMSVGEHARRRCRRYRVGRRRTRTDTTSASGAVAAAAGSSGWRRTGRVVAASTWTKIVVVVVEVIVIIVVVDLVQSLHHRRTAAARVHPFRPLGELLSLHAPVLEPDFDLALGEVKTASDLPAFLTSDVRVADELLFEHHRLVARVRLSLLALSDARRLGR